MPITDPSLYPPDWRERSRATIARAGDRCERCGAPNGAWIVRRRGGDGWREADASEIAGGLEDRRERLTRVVLTVHHKRPACEGGSHEPANLESLCQLHHLALDGPLHAANAAATRRRKADERRAAAGQAALA